MKKISLFICVFILTSVIGMSVSAIKTKTDSPFVLPEDDGTGYPVTEINDSYSCNEVVFSIKVPENIIWLDDKTFYNCTNLNQIKLHSKVQYIGEKVFEGTAYYNDSDNWEDGVLYIGDCLIKADPDKIAEDYTVKIGTRLIAAGAFKDCERLKTVTVPATIEYVGDEAFAGTFYYNNEENWSDDTLILSHLLIAVKEELSGCYAVPEGIVTIADSAFSHSKVTGISTPPSLKHIGKDAFFDCSELASVQLNSKVKTLGWGPFRRCDALNEIIVDNDNDCFAVSDGVLFNKSLSSVIRCPEKKAGNVVLPYSVIKIEAFAFERCIEITSVQIPKGCIFIGDSAFSACESLNDIIIPETMEYIDNNAFSGCIKSDSVDIPDNVGYLGKSAFSGCSNLKEVKIGNGISELRNSLFGSCEKLNTVTLGDNIRKIDKTAFALTKYISDVSNYRNGMLIVSDKYLIKVAKDVSECHVPYGVKIIADGAFEYPAEEGCISKIYLPSSVSLYDMEVLDGINEIPVYYDGRLSRFVKTTEFDRSGVNLFTNDFTKGIIITVIPTVSFILLVVCVLIINSIKTRKICAQTEEEYEEYEE